MKKIFSSFVLLMFSQIGQADMTTGELIANPFFSGEDYSGWTINSPWRDDGTNDKLVFDVNNTNTSGFPTSSTVGKDLTTETAVTSLTNYDPATTKLTALSFNDVFLETFGTPPGDGSYKFFIEFDLQTTGGDFRANSQEVTNPWGIAGTQALSMSWNTDPFASGGVALNTITGSIYKVIVNIETPTSQAATTFFTADNFSTSYTVTSIPEPSVTSLLALSAALLISRRKRRTLS